MVTRGESWRNDWPVLMPSDLLTVRELAQTQKKQRKRISELETRNALLLRFVQAYARYEDEDRYDHPTGVTSETFTEYRNAWQAVIDAGLLENDAITT